jgi:hypothetical protein
MSPIRPPYNNSLLLASERTSIKTLRHVSIADLYALGASFRIVVGHWDREPERERGFRFFRSPAPARVLARLVIEQDARSADQQGGRRGARPKADAVIDVSKRETPAHLTPASRLCPQRSYRSAPLSPQL